MLITRRLKSALSARYGSPEHPAEWDGRVYGGGKLSQRFWEYLKAIELLELTEESVVLDIGGGSLKEGAGFFANLLASAVRRVFVLDANVPKSAQPASAVTLIREAANFEVLRKLFAAHPEITHVVSVSVFEHIAPEVREEIVRGINDGFRGEVFVTTFEFHPLDVYFEHQLTARSVSALLTPLDRFFVDEFVASPVWSENAFDRKHIVRLGLNRRHTVPNLARANIPLYYPVAVRLLRRA